jgi:IclR family transcriptional regulator, KDG regulon repressor
MNETRSLMRALKILDLYTSERAEIGVTEAAQSLELSKGTVSRLMYSLELAGFLKKNCQTKKYVLGRKTIRLSRVYLSKVDLKDTAGPYLKELSEKTNELILVHVIDGDKRFCLDWIESTNPIRHVIEKEHVYAPLHAGAAGKLLLSSLSDKEINEIIQRTGLPRYSDMTITDPSKFKLEINKIREQGIAISHGEIVPHASTVSAPVRNWSGKVIAALSISWLVMDHNDGNKSLIYPDMVRETAIRLSQDLGYL